MISYPWDSVVEAMGDDGFPIYDRDYRAADLQSLNGRIFSNGVFMDEADSFVVSPAEGMNVILSTGWCCINGTFGHEPNVRELAIQSAPTTQDRIDTVVLRWNANIEMRNIDVYVKTGVASDVPVRPTLTRDSTVYEIGIADIFVARGSGAISAARITDTRLQTDRCGAVTPFMQIDTTEFFNQLQAAIDEGVGKLEEQTQVAVDLAQQAIDETLAGNLQLQIDENKEAIEKNASDIEANKEDSDAKWSSLSQTLGKLFVKVYGTKQVTLNANQGALQSIPASTPSGYTALCLYMYNMGSGSFLPAQISVSNNGAEMYVRNVSGSTITATVGVGIVCVRSSVM